MLLKAASKLTDVMKTVNNVDIKEAMNSLKDSLSLSGKVSQNINQLRKDLIKPSLPTKYIKLTTMGDESTELLFGDSISESLESLNKENKLRSLLHENQANKKTGYTQKRKFDQTESSNYRFSSKNPKRTQYQQGQKYKSYNKKNQISHTQTSNQKRYKQKQD